MWVICLCVSVCMSAVVHTLMCLPCYGPATAITQDQAGPPLQHALVASPA